MKKEVNFTYSQEKEVKYCFRELLESTDPERVKAEKLTYDEQVYKAQCDNENVKNLAEILDGMPFDLSEEREEFDEFYEK